MDCVENCGYDNLSLSRVMARVFSLKSTPLNMWVMWICIMWVETWYIRYDKFENLNISRVSHGKALPARHSWKLVVTIYHDLSHSNLVWFSSTPSSPYPNPWEVDSPNIYHTHFKCKVRFWCYWEALEEAICLVDAIGLNCVIWEAREDKTLLSQLVAGVWRARVHGAD